MVCTVGLGTKADVYHWVEQESDIDKLRAFAGDQAKMERAEKRLLWFINLIIAVENITLHGKCLIK